MGQALPSIRPKREFSFSLSDESILSSFSLTEFFRGFYFKEKEKWIFHRNVDRIFFGLVDRSTETTATSEGHDDGRDEANPSAASKVFRRGPQVVPTRGLDE